MINRKLLKQLKNAVIEHPAFTDCLEAIMSQVEYRNNGEIPMVVGPPGAGKTTLIKKATEQLLKFTKENPKLGFGPPVVIEAPSPESGEFNWRDFYRDALRDGFAEVVLNKRINIDKIEQEIKNGVIKPQYGALTVYDYRGLLLDTAQARSPIAILIDEVQNLAKSSDFAKKSDNLDVLKSLSNKLKSPIIPVGTYEAREMLYHGGQLSRRVSLLHLKRYSESRQDQRYFKAIVETISGKDLKIPLSDSVKDNTEYLYNHSLGCVGILIDWVSRAGGLAIRRSKKCISKKEMDDRRLKNIQLAAIAREISAFENEHEDKDDFSPSFYFNNVSKDDSESTKKNDNSKRRPGIRNPARDYVGRENSGAVK